MNLELTSEQIESAIYQFHRNPNAELNEFLTNTTKSISGWYYCWDLLKIHKPLEVQYYGANTLHLKIEEDWERAPEGSIKDIRDRLLQLLEIYSKSTFKPIFVKLCVTMGCFIVQTISKEWPSAIDELISSIYQAGGNPMERNMHQSTMLEILRVIPEKFRKMSLQLSSRRDISAILIDNYKKVLDLIYELLRDIHIGKEVKLQAIRAFDSWFDMGTCSRHKLNENLIFLIFDLLRSGEYFSEAAAALVTFFELPLKIKHKTSVTKYLKLVTDLAPVFDSESHNIDVAQSLTNLFTRAATKNIESMLDFMAVDGEDSRTCLELIHLVLRTVNIQGRYPVQEMSSNISFDFWSALHDSAMNRNVNQSFVQIVKQCLLELLVIANNKIKYPSDNEYNNRNQEEIETFNLYRDNFVDCVNNITPLLQSESIQQMIQLMEIEISKTDNGLKVGWQEFESIFLIMTSIIEKGHLNAMESISVSDIFAMLPRINFDHPKLVSQILLFVGVSVRYLDDQMYKESIDFILNNLQRKEVLTAASGSLISLITDNCRRIRLKNEQIAHGIHQVLLTVAIDISDCQVLVRCLALVLATLPAKRYREVIQENFVPKVNTLHEILNSGVISDQHLTTTVDTLKILATFFCSLKIKDKDPDNFIFLFIHESLACVKRIVVSFYQNETVMTESFRLVNAICLTLSSDLDCMGSIICDIVSSAYELNALPCILDSARNIFRQSSNTPQFDVLLKSTFFSICQKSLKILDQNHREHPDIVDHFMGFMTTAINNISKFIEHEPQLSLMLFNAGMAGMAMNEADAATASCQFLGSFLSKVTSTQIIKTNGKHLLELLISSMAERFPLDKEHLLADIFVALKKDFYEGFLKTNLPQILFRDQFPTPIATRDEKMKLYQAIMDSKDKKEIRDNIKLVTIRWRKIICDENDEIEIVLKY